jgi:hypothetical protein
LKGKLKKQNVPQVLVVRPNFEVATQYGWYYQDKYVIQKCKELNIPYVDLQKSLAVKYYFDNTIKINDPILITGTGHGNSRVYTGQNYDVLLAKCNLQDAELVKGRWLSLLSCEFGQSFDWWYGQGVEGIYGYNRTFYFSGETYPDNTALLFFDSHHAFDLCLLDGLAAKDSWDKSTETWNHHIAEAPEDVARYLVWDRDSRVFMGDWNGNPFKPPTPSGKKYKILIVGVDKARLWDRVKGRVEIEGECTLEEL